MDIARQWQPLLPRLEEAMATVLRSGRFILGPQVQAFEEEAAAYLGAGEAIGVANGTDAISIALRAVGVEPGDEVICPSYTFFASAEGIAAIGATPVFVDIDPQTYCLDPQAVELAISERTTAIMAVHLFGHPADLDAIGQIAERRGLAVVEDAAQAFGARLPDGRRVGSVGDIATFSFFPTKNLSTLGDGGLITCRDAAVAERVRMLRFHGSRDKQTFELIGYNSRLDELHAAFLRVFLPELEGWNAARMAAGARYADLGLGAHGTVPPAGIHHLYALRTSARDAVFAACRERGVEARVYYGDPLHTQPVFAHLGQTDADLPETGAAAREVIALPMFPTISREQQAEVVAAVAAAVVAVA